jgi:hypothetical protein
MWVTVVVSLAFLLFCRSLLGPSIQDLQGSNTDLGCTLSYLRDLPENTT